jgi:hypothetical protein
MWSSRSISHSSHDPKRESVSNIEIIVSSGVPKDSNLQLIHLVLFKSKFKALFRPRVKFEKTC